jgi:hypothetical protein
MGHYDSCYEHDAEVEAEALKRRKIEEDALSRVAFQDAHTLLDAAHKRIYKIIPARIAINFDQIFDFMKANSVN